MSPVENSVRGSATDGYVIVFYVETVVLVVFGLHVLGEMAQGYNGLTFEQFVWAFIKSQILCAGPRVFRSENLYCKILNEKEKNIYD